MRLSDRAAFYLQASIILFFLAGSAAPTPLYAVYQAEWGLSPITVTFVFGIYAVAVLGALLVAGALSDFVGRRPVLVVAGLLQAVTMVLFATAGGLGDLIAARILQGLATGGAASAVGAGMLDLDRQRGTIANAVAPLLGTAAGGLLSGFFADHLPAPTVLVYLVLGAVFVVQAIAVLAIPETVARRPGALASLRPQLRLPAHVRGTLFIVAPAIIAAWALIGLYGSLGPTLVRRLAGSSSLALGGLALFVLAGGGALTVLLTHMRPARSVLTFGTVALGGGVAITLHAIGAGSIGLFFAGAAVAGVGFGASLHAAMRMVIPLAAPHERAGVLSVVYVIGYLSLGLPAVLAGERVVHGGGLIGTAGEYGVAVMILAALALAGVLLTAPVLVPVVERSKRPGSR